MQFTDHTYVTEIENLHYITSQSVGRRDVLTSNGNVVQIFTNFNRDRRASGDHGNVVSDYTNQIYSGTTDAPLTDHGNVVVMDATSDTISMQLTPGGNVHTLTSNDRGNVIPTSDDDMAPDVDIARTFYGQRRWRSGTHSCSTPRNTRNRKYTYYATTRPNRTESLRGASNCSR